MGWTGIYCIFAVETTNEFVIAIQRAFLLISCYVEIMLFQKKINIAIGWKFYQEQYHPDPLPKFSV